MSTCRDCPAEVIFARSNKSARLMILNAEPEKRVVAVRTVMGTGERIVLAVQVDGAKVKPTNDDALVSCVVMDVYTDHHATCPKAADWKGQTRATRKGTIQPPIDPVVMGGGPTRGHGRGIRSGDSLGGMWDAVRYIYLGTRETDPALKGQPCDPVRDRRRKCIRGKGNMLVRFADGSRRVVVARRLRIQVPLGHVDGGRRAD